MKLKNLIKLPEKTVFEKDDCGDIIVSTTDFIDAGENGMIDQIGEIEKELDVEKIAKIIEDMGYVCIKSDKPREAIELAQTIVDNFKEIIK